MRSTRCSETLASIPAASGVTLTASGVGAFSVLMEGRTRAATQSLAQWATIGMLLVLLVAYRSVGAIVLSSLPLASAALAGLAAVSAVFGAVHGITLAFGFTLIGVAQDYPIHLLSHSRPGVAPARIAKQLWPTLATGVASTSVAYLTFWFSGVTGLAQLACFAVVGLAVAGLTTRFLVPVLMAEGRRDYGSSALLRRVWNAIATPAPATLGGTDHDRRLRRRDTARAPAVLGERPGRADAGAARSARTRSRAPPAARHGGREVFDRRRSSECGRGPDAARSARRPFAGTRGARCDRRVHARREVSAVAGRTTARRAQLPDAATLRTALEAAQAGTAFRPGAFAPFLADVERARTLPPLTLERARATPLGPQIDALLIGPRRFLRGARDLQRRSKTQPRCARWPRRTPSRCWILGTHRPAWSKDSERECSRALGVGALLLIGIVAFALRDRARVLRVLAPMALTTLIIVAALHAAGLSLNLFHLISLILAAGLGLDYALFFEHAADDPAEQGRTLHAILVSAASTFMVFALLAVSELPVLRSIGVPITIGVVANFVLALLLTRPQRQSTP